MLFYRDKPYARSIRVLQNELFDDGAFAGLLFVVRREGLEFNLDRQLILKGLHPHFYHVRVLEMLTKLMREVPECEFLKQKFKMFVRLGYLAQLMRLDDVLSPKYMGQTLFRQHFHLKGKVLALVTLLYLESSEDKPILAELTAILELLCGQLQAFAAQVKSPELFIRENLNTVVLTKGHLAEDMVVSDFKDRLH